MPSNPRNSGVLSTFRKIRYFVESLQGTAREQGISASRCGFWMFTDLILTGI
jgi:hypothetical protein